MQWKEAKTLFATGHEMVSSRHPQCKKVVGYNGILQKHWEELFTWINQRTCSLEEAAVAHQVLLILQCDNLHLLFLLSS